MNALRSRAETRTVAAVTAARHLIIHGRVQGVFYRGWAIETARALGLTGWVRNRRDGTVEALVQGEGEAVARFIELAQGGPQAARVERVETRDANVEEGPVEFRQEATV